MRKTKIICTIGPACEDGKTLKEMCRAGMNVARLNFSHGTHAEHARRIETICRVREELDLPIAILLDTRGPHPHIPGRPRLPRGRTDLHLYHGPERRGRQDPGGRVL